MGLITFTSSGSTSNMQAFLKRVTSGNLFKNLEVLAQQGVVALASATPVDTGATASAWTYEIETNRNLTRISWINGHRPNGPNVVLLLQYGHGTGTGGYVSGYDFINPAIQPIFDQIADDVWKEVVLA